MYRNLSMLCLLLMICLPAAAQQDQTVQPTEAIQVVGVEQSDKLPARTFASLNQEQLGKSRKSQAQPDAKTPDTVNGVAPDDLTNDDPLNPKPAVTQSQSVNAPLFDDARAASKRSPLSFDEDAANAVMSNGQTAPEPEWEFSITPYLFTAGLHGTVGARGRFVDVDASFSDIFDRLDFGLMGTFEARKGNWGFLVDTMYISLSNETTTRGLLFSGVNSESKLFIIDPEMSYRAFANDKGASIDILAGVRIWHLKNDLTFLPGLLAPQVEVSESKNWADPVVGARGVIALSPRLFLNGKFDVGGVGVGSDFTGQVYGGAGINVKPRVALIGGYRYLYVDYKSDGFLFRSALKGLVFGATFKF